MAKKGPGNELSRSGKSATINLTEFNLYLSFLAPGMSSIDSLEVQEEIQTILESGGFLRDVEIYLKKEFPNITRGLSRRSIRRYCLKQGLRRFSAQRLDKKEKEQAIIKAAREVSS